jgi:serine-type D-Ala-D-Ala carboxypeptidase/endopeptidase (penicillin-binding protein 4)
MPRSGKLCISLSLALMLIVVYSCSPYSQITRSVRKNILGDSAFSAAHTGISVYDPMQGKYLFRYQDNKYFIPASNTKIITCYSAMKFLGEQIPGIFYTENDTALFLVPSGDPTFLHQDFIQQPVADLIKKAVKKIYISPLGWNEKPLGPGWSWDDYSEGYMPERSAFPVYGNIIRWYQVKTIKENPASSADSIDTFIYSDPEMEGEVSFGKPAEDKNFSVERKRDHNAFVIHEGSQPKAEVEVPFITNGILTALQLVKDSLHKEIIPLEGKFPLAWKKDLSLVYSRPLDSMLRPMMHRSDNFFAEQTLLMAGYKLTGEMNSEAAIKRLLETELSGFPDKPRWVDGSGLSRYNLFTPDDFIWILTKMKNEFSWERLSTIFPTGGTGTLGNTYRQDSGRIFAKTGTLSGVAALSGFLITKKNRVLVFSVMINNHRQTAARLRKSVASFLHDCIINY